MSPGGRRELHKKKEGRQCGMGAATVTSGDMYSVARIEAALKQTPSSKQGGGGAVQTRSKEPQSTGSGAYSSVEIKQLCTRHARHLSTK